MTNLINKGLISDLIKELQVVRIKELLVKEGRKNGINSKYYNILLAKYNELTKEKWDYTKHLSAMKKAKQKIINGKKNILVAVDYLIDHSEEGIVFNQAYIPPKAIMKIYTANSGLMDEKLLKEIVRALEFPLDNETEEWKLERFKICFVEDGFKGDFLYESFYL